MEQFNIQEKNNVNVSYKKYDVNVRNKTRNTRSRSIISGNRLLLSAGIYFIANLSSFGAEVVSDSADNLRIPYEGKNKFNFIFILADDLGWRCLEGYGSDLHETSNIDRFAKESMKFTNAYSASLVCSPTRAALLTGKHPARLNMTTWRENSGSPEQNNHNILIGPTTVGNVPLEEYTIAEALREEGYFTASVGKWHIGDVVHYPEAHGFDMNIGGTIWGMPFTYWYPFRGWRAIDGEYRYVPGLEDIYADNENTYLTDRLTDEALKIIEAKKDEPFFLYLSYYTPHVPIEGKPGYVEYFQRKINQELIHRNPGYAAMIASLDENIGRVLNKIEELGISDNTVIVFYSDNGGLATARVNTNNNYPLRSGKGSLYEGGIRVPLIIKWPGHTDPGSICNYPVNSMDFYPTFLEIANIAGDEKQNMNFDGKSLVPLLNDSETSLDRKSLFWHYPHYYMGITTPVSAIRKGKWKLLHYYENNRLELYNLEKDVSEEHDLANEYPGLAEELYILLKNNLKEVNAKHPSYNSNYIQVQ